MVSFSSFFNPPRVLVVGAEGKMGWPLLGTLRAFQVILLLNESGLLVLLLGIDSVERQGERKRERERERERKREREREREREKERKCMREIHT